MGSNKCHSIKENYSLYNILLEERKSVFSEVIEINRIGNNANTLSKLEPVVHSQTDEIVLIVDVKVNNYNFFQFKLRYKSFSPLPFFRFDSDGETHRNRIDGVLLEEQSITTPHFHKFTKDGIEIAYKTDKLLDKKERKALEDINLCAVHFFHESNIRLNKKDFPEIKISTDTLGLSYLKDDPNQNIKF
jgi:hypothetical protein